MGDVYVLYTETFDSKLLQLGPFKLPSGEKLAGKLNGEDGTFFYNNQTKWMVIRVDESDICCDTRDPPSADTTWVYFSKGVVVYRGDRASATSKMRSCCPNAFVSYSIIDSATSEKFKIGHKCMVDIGDCNKIEGDNFNNIAVHNHNIAVFNCGNSVTLNNYNQLKANDGNFIQAMVKNRITVRNKNNMVLGSSNKIKAVNSNTIVSKWGNDIVARDENDIIAGEESKVTVENNNTIRVERSVVICGKGCTVFADVGSVVKAGENSTVCFYWQNDVKRLAVMNPAMYKPDVFYKCNQQGKIVVV